MQIKSSYLLSFVLSLKIQILAEKAFKDNWFNKEYDLSITKTDLIELLEVATKNQLFNLKEICMSKWTGLPCALRLGH